MVCCFPAMFRGRLRRITVFHRKNHRKLTWSLQPLFLWLQILGIPTGRSLVSSVTRRCVVLILGVLIMIWVVSSRTYRVFNGISNLRDVTVTRAELWSTTLYHLNDNLGGILISLNLFIVCHLNWNSLWKNACEIEQRLKFDETSYSSLRKMSAAILMLLSMVNCMQYCIYLLFDSIQSILIKLLILIDFRTLLFRSLDV